MTRKRFIKLMMARGYDRNGAHKLAAEARKANRSYAEYFLFYTSFEKKLQDAVCAVGEAIPRVVEQLLGVAKALGESVKAFCDKFAEVWSET